MAIPILGSAVESIPPQARLNIAAMVDETMATTQKLGLRIGRLKLQMPLDSNDVTYPLMLEEFQNKGCSFLAINEVAVPLPTGAIMLVSIMFQLPPTVKPS